jgi:hypothetical protein
MLPGNSAGRDQRPTSFEGVPPIKPAVVPHLIVSPDPRSQISVIPFLRMLNLLYPSTVKTFVAVRVPVDGISLRSAA